MIIRKESVAAAAFVAALFGTAAAQDSFGQQPPPQDPNAQQGYPQQQQQPGQYPQAPGGYPQDGGGYPQQPGGYPQQPGGYPQQPGGGYPQQPGGGYPQQPGGYPQQPGGGYPQQPGQSPQQPGQYPQQPQQGGADLDQLMQMERQDYGVAPTKQLHSGAMHGPTPASIPGGQVITTKGLVALVQGKQAPYMLFDVLGAPETLPGAIPAAWVSQAGSFNDQIQQQFGQALQQGTQGKKDLPLIFYCMSTQCWMSYNAALRAINLGYTNVLWYRGGLEAWQMAGLPTQSAQQMQQQPMQGQQMPGQQMPGRQ